MATGAQMRAWLVEHGHPELDGGVGRLSNSLRAEYNAAHEPPGDDDYGAGTDPGDFEGDPGWVAADDPPEPPPLGDVPDDGAGAAAAEERPSRPRANARSWFRSSKTPRGGRKSSRKPPRPKGKRLSVAPLIEDMYSDLAWATAGIPPLQRLLYAQAPIAGVVLDQHARGTFIDTALQPLARNYELAKVGTALVGTPAALMAVLMTAPGPAVHEDGTPVLVPVLGPDGQPNGQTMMTQADPSPEHMVAMVGLRMCVRAMADVAGGDSLARVQERAEENKARDDQVNDFIAYLLGMPGPPPGAEETAEREARAAGLRLAGATIE